MRLTITPQDVQTFGTGPGDNPAALALSRQEGEPCTVTQTRLSIDGGFVPTPNGLARWLYRHRFLVLLGCNAPLIYLEPASFLIHVRRSRKAPSAKG
jgi:hypothetical protein